MFRRARATTFVKRLGQRTRLIGDWRMNSKMKFPISEKRRESRTVFREKPGSECVRRSKRSERKAAVFNLVKHRTRRRSYVTVFDGTEGVPRTIFTKRDNFSSIKAIEGPLKLNRFLRRGTAMSQITVSESGIGSGGDSGRRYIQGNRCRSSVLR